MEEQTSSCDGPFDMDPAMRENFLALIAQHEQVRKIEVLKGTFQSFKVS